MTAPYSDRARSIAPSYATPKTAAKTAALGSAPAEATERRKRHGGSLGPAGGPNESIKVGQIKLTKREHTHRAVSRSIEIVKSRGQADGPAHVPDRKRDPQAGVINQARTASGPRRETAAGKLR